MPQELRRLPFKLKGELQMKNAVSRFGKSLSGMVMPNIGAFIAWGFLTALFIEAGWFPNEKLASMVSPMLTYLLPIFIAGQGGKMVAGDRGRVIAAIAVVGCICGSGYTMLMGAMVMGPLAG
jgi:PTS system mannitol-specific IIC component